MPKYTEDEQRKINFQREQIKRAKKNLSLINEMAIERESLANERRRQDEAKLVEQSKIDKEDFDDRVRLFLSKVSRELKTLDLKLVGDARTGGYTMSRTRLEVKDNKSAQVTTVKVIGGKGFEWE